MTSILLALPWLGLLVFVRFFTRLPSELPESAGRLVPPSVSVIVPARNEARDIVGCLRSVAASKYPDFEIVVVDDRSEDTTAALARSVPRGNARRLTVVEGRPLPDGWLGKPWACQQGTTVATGEILVFTDADTTHGPALLGRVVAGCVEEEADLLTLVGRQLMESFWERLVQPQIFLAMLLRFPDFERVARNDRWRDAIANGQYMLFPRASYDRIGGHESVRDEVVEDLALAQRIKRAGLRLRVRSAERDFATRMYRSLGELVEGWSKNIVIGGLQSFPRLLRPLVAPLSFLGGVVLWLVPPVALVLGLVGAVGAGFPVVGAVEPVPAVVEPVPAMVQSVPAMVQPVTAMVGPVAAMVPSLAAMTRPLIVWAGIVVATSVVLWGWFTRQMGAPGLYGLLYPLGSMVTSYIFLRSWTGGRNVRWKGRRYRLPPLSDRA